MNEILSSLPKTRIITLGVLHARNSTPTDRERSLASGATELTEAIVAEYAEVGKQLNQNIKAMFEKQAAEARVPWNQDHFETLMAKWVASCDQPFVAVIQDEFCEMLRYVYHHSPSPLKIPSHEAVKARVQKMSEKCTFRELENIQENKSYFECLIDFRELVGQHSGENMTAAVWQTAEKFGFTGRLQEVIGPLTKEEKCAAKSKSPASAYQDSATKSLAREVDEDAGGTEDSDENDIISPESAIGAALQKIIRHVLSSPQRRKEWEAEVETASPGGKILILILDVKTWWSSTHQILRASFILR
ncbi:hypothetical protein B0H13DRAFT_2537367 [Mycena leptocephala]|nr:hypothetical protein B0H13DRAFT_2537367 [Mycena leptocephala]